MASSDSDIIAEARAFTDYDTTIFSDSEIQAIVDIGKEEIRAELGDPSFTFYREGETNTHDADRALFWFTCLGLKVRAGEIASANLTVGSLRSTSYSNSKHRLWFQNLEKRLRSASGSSAGHVQVSRDNRTYGE